MHAKLHKFLQIAKSKSQRVPQNKDTKKNWNKVEQWASVPLPNQLDFSICIFSHQFNKWWDFRSQLGLCVLWRITKLVENTYTIHFFFIF